MPSTEAIASTASSPAAVSIWAISRFSALAFAMVAGSPSGSQTSA